MIELLTEKCLRTEIPVKEECKSCRGERVFCNDYTPVPTKIDYKTGLQRFICRYGYEWRNNLH